MLAIDIYCKSCNLLIKQADVGRIPVYCSPACKQAAFRLRKNDGVHHRVSRRLKSQMLAAPVPTPVNRLLALRNNFQYRGRSYEDYFERAEFDIHVFETSLRNYFLNPLHHTKFEIFRDWVVHTFLKFAGCWEPWGSYPVCEDYVIANVFADIYFGVVESVYPPSVHLHRFVFWGVTVSSLTLRNSPVIQGGVNG